jgi:hypothetical protein
MEIREKPIMFSTEMIRAILDHRKSMTRRVMKPQPHLIDNIWFWTHRKMSWGLPNQGEIATILLGIWDVAPYQVGMRLWVRESWRVMGVDDQLAPCEISSQYAPIVQYKDTQPGPQDIIMGKWRPSIFMPRWASRITLEVTEVRAQIVGDITEEDAITEGFKADQWVSAKGHFAMKWDELNEKRGYPYSDFIWVWAITFQVMK